MATYLEIQNEVKSSSGFVPKTCWIAHVLSDNGKTQRLAPNRKSASERVSPCPVEKRKPIEAALRKHGMI